MYGGSRTDLWRGTLVKITKKVLNQIETVIEAAQNFQAETGPDPDYRRYAAEELAAAKEKLIKLISDATK